jgi:hypothetical protein
MRGKNREFRVKRGELIGLLRVKECPENKEEVSKRAGPLWKRKINLIINE